MNYSVQQIKYEILLYMKEFGGRFAEWQVDTCDDPEQALERERASGADVAYWIFKPAVSPRAATTVTDYFHNVLDAGGRRAPVADENARFVLARRYRVTTAE